MAEPMTLEAAQLQDGDVLIFHGPADCTQADAERFRDIGDRVVERLRDQIGIRVSWIFLSGEVTLQVLDRSSRLLPCLSENQWHPIVSGVADWKPDPRTELGMNLSTSVFGQPGRPWWRFW